MAQPMKTSHRNRGFSLIELLLVLGVIAVLLVGMFVVYPMVRADMRANKEVAFIAAALARVQSQFPPSSYRGLANVWVAARDTQKAEWATSPSGWNWRFQEARLVNNIPQQCDGAATRCTHIWLQLYRDAERDPQECVKVLSKLGTSIKISGYTNPGPETFFAQCAADGPVFVSLYTS